MLLPESRRYSGQRLASLEADAFIVVYESCQFPAVRLERDFARPRDTPVRPILRIIVRSVKLRPVILQQSVATLCVEYVSLSESTALVVRVC